MWTKDDDGRTMEPAYTISSLMSLKAQVSQNEFTREMKTFIRNKMGHTKMGHTT